jgi:Arc/MetJ-type ribon-helix-helix transcriptional regulator
MTTKITFQIPKELKQKLEERIKQTNFKSIPDYLLFVLEQITSDVVKKQGYTKEEEEEIKGNVRWGEHTERKGYSEEEELELKKDLEEAGYM